MQETANKILEGLMRAGYASRGAVYLIVGGLAFYAAFSSDTPHGTSGALAYLIAKPFGAFLLALVALGLFSYTAWRLADGIFDLECEGDDPHGLANRAGQIMSGLTHAALGISALVILWKGQQATDGSSTENWSRTLMEQPYGRWLVMAAGVTTLSVAVYLFIKAWKASYRRDIRQTWLTSALSPAIRFGLAAHGFVLMVVGGLILLAGLNSRPEQAAGMGKALRILENASYGTLLLSITGIGLIGFSLYCFVSAWYRIVPRLKADDLPTLL